MRNVKKMVSWGTVVLLLALLSLPGWSLAADRVITITTDAEAERVLTAEAARRNVSLDIVVRDLARAGVQAYTDRLLADEARALETDYMSARDAQKRQAAREALK